MNILVHKPSRSIETAQRVKNGKRSTADWFNDLPTWYINRFVVWYWWIDNFVQFVTGCRSMPKQQTNLFYWNLPTLQHSITIICLLKHACVGFYCWLKLLAHCDLLQQNKNRKILIPRISKLDFRTLWLFIEIVYGRCGRQCVLKKKKKKQFSSMFSYAPDSSLLSQVPQFSLWLEQPCCLYLLLILFWIDEQILAGRAALLMSVLF